MEPRSITSVFLEELFARQSPGSSITIKASNDRALDLKSVDAVVEGRDWFDHLAPGNQYDFVVADLPLSMGRHRANIGVSTINVRANWIELSKALRLTSPTGICVAVVEPTAFGIAEGPNFQRALEDEGFYLNGIFNAPPHLLTSTSLRPVLVAFSREQKPSLFIAELEEETQARALAQAFFERVCSESLYQGICLSDCKFDGFESLKARLQLDKLETQYKDYRSYILGDIAVQINTARAGEFLEPKDNAIYVPMLGTSDVTEELSAVTIKHHNVIQVVLPDSVKSKYVAAFFRSDLGLLVLRSLTRGAVIKKITKNNLAQAQVAIPGLKDQEEIIRSHSRLETLTEEIAKLQRELALNPQSASTICGQVDGMLETIGGLTEADKVMSLVREGESGTVEFKETFSLDVRKGKKEEYIELSALKTMVAFLNTNGGMLLVGVTDDGEISGIGEEVKKFHKNNNDKFLLHFKNRLKVRIGEQNYPFIDHKLVDLGSVHVLAVNCMPASSPCYLDGKDFYVRTNPATDKLEGPKLVEYVQNHFSL
ncbi:MAG: putative DNA binding domain-containing protein [Marinobacter sp.]|nr:putative DNA binding domain-containing protein [Marinobacter sp.]